MTLRADPEALIEQLRLLTADSDSYFWDDAQKHEFQRLARGAATAVETPVETMQRLVYSPLPLVTARIGQDRGIFDVLAKSQDGTTLDDMSQAAAIPKDILETILDYLCTQGMALESSPATYKATSLTHMLLTPLFNDAVTHFHDTCAPAFLALNRVLSTPEETKTAFQIGHHSTENFSTWLEAHPIQQGVFHRFVEAQSSSLPTWLSAIPFDTEIAHNTTAEDILFVSVSGGNGSQCLLLKQVFPNLKGRIILQDQPAILASALSVPGMETMAHDFMAEQPVHNAHAYHLPHLLHNKPDNTAIHILQMHLPALRHNPASRLYIEDKILPEKTPFDKKPQDEVENTAALHLSLIATLGTRGRREKHWRWLVDQAGMEVCEILYGDGSGWGNGDRVVVVRRREQDGWR